MASEENMSGGGPSNFGDSSSSDQEDEEQITFHVPFLKGNHFDVLSYAAKYRGRSKIHRLLTIADRCGSDDERQLEALRIAYKEAKKGEDVDLFTKIVEKISGRLGPRFVMDENWCNSVNESWDVMKEKLVEWAIKLEDDYESDLISPEGVRTAWNVAANLYYVHGEALAAHCLYMLSERFCWIPEDYCELFSRAAVVLIEMGGFSGAEKITKQGFKHMDLLDPFTLDTIRCTIGLASLKDQRFKDAAHQFLQISEELGNQFSVVMAAHDVAAYGGLCAVATLERNELKTLVMDNQNFQSYLDSAIEVKELINDFYSRCYSSAFKHLDNLREWLSLDIYLFDQYEALHERIRNKALVQYIQPFVAVDLQTMADVFNTSIEDLKKELVALINTNQIKAKIDSIDNVLYVRNDQRNATFRRVLQSCSVIERDLRTILLFKSVLHHDYVQNDD